MASSSERPDHQDLIPDPGLSRDAMIDQQAAVAAAAAFHDATALDASDLTIDTPIDPERGESEPSEPLTAAPADPIVVGIDQAVSETDGRTMATSVAVALRDGRVVETARERVPVEMPYVPGLLSYREAPAVLAALDALEVDPDLLLIDGSGRIHFRQAGLATHVGVVRDTASVGVAKSLLCGTPRRSLPDDGLPAGARVAIRAGADVSAPDGAVLGHVFQSRQFPGDRHVNPLIVSPGHRLSPGTATDLVAHLCAGYKLPEPTRVADRLANQGPDQPD